MTHQTTKSNSLVIVKGRNAEAEGQHAHMLSDIGKKVVNEHKLVQLPATSYSNTAHLNSEGSLRLASLHATCDVYSRTKQSRPESLLPL
jgi:hypothetical protein